MMEDDQPTEETGLLDPAPTVSPAPLSEVSGPTVRRTILSAAAVLLALNIGSHVTFAPQTAILQNIVCRNYYADSASGLPPLPAGGNEDGRCGIEPIQSEVALINAWKDVSEALPGMMLAVPYGMLADRIGRKTILLLAIIGCLLDDVWIRIVYWFPDIFPVRAVWFGGLWQLIGAGAATFSSVSFVLVADVCPAEQRTTAFAQIQAATLVSRLVFVPLGGALISTSPWIPMAFGMLAMVIGFFVAVVFIPETLPLPSAPKFSGNDEDQGDHVDENRRFGKTSLIPQRVGEHINACLEVGRWVIKNYRLVLVLSCFLLFHLGEQADMLLMLQYVAKRLSWTIGRASFISAVGAAVNLVVLTLLIPALSSFFVRRLDLHEMVKDKRIAQLSGIFLVIGSVTVAIATNWAVLVLGQVLSSLGYGFTVPARSFVTGMVEQRHLGALYTAISVLTYTGVIAGGPLFAAAFRWGLRSGEAWFGLPFLIAAICFLLVVMAVSATAVRPKEEDRENATEPSNTVSE